MANISNYEHIGALTSRVKPRQSTFELENDLVLQEARCEEKLAKTDLLNLISEHERHCDSLMSDDTEIKILKTTGLVSNMALASASAYSLSDTGENTTLQKLAEFNVMTEKQIAKDIEKSERLMKLVNNSPPQESQASQASQTSHNVSVDGTAQSYGTHTLAKGQPSKRYVSGSSVQSGTTLADSTEFQDAASRFVDNLDAEQLEYEKLQLEYDKKVLLGAKIRFEQEKRVLRQERESLDKEKHSFDMERQRFERVQRALERERAEFAAPKSQLQTQTQTKSQSQSQTKSQSKSQSDPQSPKPKPMAEKQIQHRKIRSSTPETEIRLELANTKLGNLQEELEGHKKYICTLEDCVTNLAKENAVLKFDNARNKKKVYSLVYANKYLEYSCQDLFIEAPLSQQVQSLGNLHTFKSNFSQLSAKKKFKVLATLVLAGVRMTRQTQKSQKLTSRILKILKKPIL